MFLSGRAPPGLNAPTLQGNKEEEGEEERKLIPGKFTAASPSKTSQTSQRENIHSPYDHILMIVTSQLTHHYKQIRTQVSLDLLKGGKLHFLPSITHSQAPLFHQAQKSQCIGTKPLLGVKRMFSYVILVQLSLCQHGHKICLHIFKGRGIHEGKSVQGPQNQNGTLVPQPISVSYFPSLFPQNPQGELWTKMPTTLSTGLLYHSGIEETKLGWGFGTCK